MGEHLWGISVPIPSFRQVFSRNPAREEGKVLLQIRTHTTLTEEIEMKKLLSTLFVLVLLLVFAGGSRAGETASAGEIVPGIPVKDTVTLVDLGATTCIPCKMMMPILAELKKEYKGRVEVNFIDVWDQANAGKAQAFKIQIIPTQIFFDRHGKEVFRHVGFFDKKSITAKLDAILRQE